MKQFLQRLFTRMRLVAYDKKKAFDYECAQNYEMRSVKRWIDKNFERVFKNIHRVENI